MLVNDSGSSKTKWHLPGALWLAASRAAAALQTAWLSACKWLQPNRPAAQSHQGGCCRRLMQLMQPGITRPPQPAAGPPYAFLQVGQWGGRNFEWATQYNQPAAVSTHVSTCVYLLCRYAMS